MKFLNVGKLVNTHGIKGEVRLISSFKYKDKVFIPKFKVYIGSSKEEFEIERYRKHKNFDMLTFKGIDNINSVLYLKGSFVYINKDDLKLDKNEFLAVDLIEFNVIINDKNVGVIKDAFETPANEVLTLDNGVMIPYVKAFIKKIDIKNKKVFINDVKGLIS